MTFTAISPRAFEHEADRAALAALRKMTGFDTILKKIVGAFGERRIRLLFLANAVRINERQRPDVYQIFLEACSALDLPETSELYITSSPELNAMAVGIDRPFVVINSGAVQSCTREELRCILGHEAGHILSGHALYRTTLFILLRLMNVALPQLLSAVALPVLAALQEWSRKSELSADRAGLLVSQDLAVSTRVCLRLAGGGDIANYNIEEFERQAQEYQDEGTAADKLFKLLNLVWTSHPFPALRIVELKKWHQSGRYDAILRGEYPRRSSDEPLSWQEDVRNGVNNYMAGFAAAKDSLNRLLQDAMDIGGDIAQEVGRLFRGEKRGRDSTPSTHDH